MAFSPILEMTSLNLISLFANTYFIPGAITVNKIFSNWKKVDKSETRTLSHLKSLIILKLELTEELECLFYNTGSSWL